MPFMPDIPSDCGYCSSPSVMPLTCISALCQYRKQQRVATCFYTNTETTLYCTLYGGRNTKPSHSTV